MSKVPILIRICKKLKPLFPNEALYLKVRFRLAMGYNLNLRSPKTFSEKLQWLKLYAYKPEYTTMVDKYAVKEYVSQKIGPEYVIPTLGIWEQPEDIEWNKLPKQFVLKTTHGGGGGGVVICRNKSDLDIPIINRTLHISLNQNIAKYSCEKPYMEVPHRIIAEKFIEPPKGSDDLYDYKFFCFKGKVKFFKVDFGRFVNHRANYYSPDGLLLPYGEVVCRPDPNAEITLPSNLDEMIHLAEALSSDIPFLRVDLYNVNGRILFGELTFYPASGLSQWTSIEWDKQIGDMLDLNNIN